MEEGVWGIAVASSFLFSEFACFVGCQCVWGLRCPDMEEGEDLDGSLGKT